MIDLRSDTVTAPSQAMREAMAGAEVGDDVYGEDPTVRRLEETAAERLGKEAALFVPSGTMANQLAIMVWTRPGQQVLFESRSHIVLYEMAATSLLSGVAPYLLHTDEGWFSAETVAARLAAPESYGSTSTTLVCVENSHNRAGGRIFPQTELVRLGELCRSRGLRLHLDGARLFNAAVASGASAASLAEPADSLMFCLSKGLGCPVGSVLCGPADFIARARELRALLGGAMRQAGVLAAAGLLALDTMVERLAEDHRRAARLAAGLAELPGVSPRRVETNILNFEVASPAAQVVQGLRARGVAAFAIDHQLIRMVCHCHITDADIEATIQAVAAAA